MDCSPAGSSVHAIFQARALEWGAMTNLDTVLKSEAISLLTKACIVNGFPVVMYGCKSWTIRKVERWRIDAFKLWCWQRLLRGPWTARRSNQSILKELNPEYSLEGLMPKLKLRYFGPLIRKADSLEKALMLGKIEGRRRRVDRWDGWMASQTQWHEFSKLQEIVKNRGAWHA